LEKNAITANEMSERVLVHTTILTHQKGFFFTMEDLKISTHNFRTESIFIVVKKHKNEEPHICACL
jgi:hypothetical protein